MPLWAEALQFLRLFDRQRQSGRVGLGTPIALRGVLDTVEVVNSGHGLAHQQNPAVTGANSQSQHATELARSTVDRFSETPAAKIIPGFSAATDVSPEPEKILPTLIGRMAGQ